MNIGPHSSAALKLRIASALSLLLAGCTSYHAQPVALSAILDSSRTRHLDFAAVNHRLAAIGSGAVTAPPWGRLALFAAATLYNPRILAAQAAVATALANEGAVRQWPNLNLTLTSEYARDPAASSSWLFGGAIDVPLDLGGRRAARVTSASLGVLQSRYDLAEAIWSVRMDLAHAFAAHAASVRRIAVLDDLVAARNLQFTVMQNRVAAGTGTRADLERARAESVDAVRQRGDAEAGLALSEQNLATAVGIPASELASLPITWEGISDKLDLPEPIDAQVIRISLLSRADVLKAVVAYDLSETALREEIARQFPSISIAPGYTWERGLVKLPFSIGLQLPPLDLNRHAIAAAEARRAEAGRQLEATVAAADAAVSTALLQLAAAQTALAQVRSGELRAAEGLALQADRELKAGKIDRASWAAAQSGLALARLSELDALGQVQAAFLTLEDALRSPLAGPERAIRPAALEKNA